MSRVCIMGKTAPLTTQASSWWRQRRWRMLIMRWMRMGRGRSWMGASIMACLFSMMSRWESCRNSPRMALWRRGASNSRTMGMSLWKRNQAIREGMPSQRQRISSKTKPMRASERIVMAVSAIYRARMKRHLVLQNVSKRIPLIDGRPFTLTTTPFRLTQMKLRNPTRTRTAQAAVSMISARMRRRGRRRRARGERNPMETTNTFPRSWRWAATDLYPKTTLSSTSSTKSIITQISAWTTTATGLAIPWISKPDWPKNPSNEGF